jgi:hypothetical protein
MNMIKRHEIAGENGVTPDGATPGKKGHHQMANHVEIGPALNHAERQGCFLLIT